MPSPAGRVLRVEDRRVIYLPLALIALGAALLVYARLRDNEAWFEDTSSVRALASSIATMLAIFGGVALIVAGVIWLGVILAVKVI